MSQRIRMGVDEKVKIVEDCIGGRIGQTETAGRIGVAGYTVMLTFSHTMRDKEKDVLAATASSVHCFINRDARPVVLKKYFPELDRIWKEAGEHKQTRCKDNKITGASSLRRMPRGVLSG